MQFDLFEMPTTIKTDHFNNLETVNEDDVYFDADVENSSLVSWGGSWTVIFNNSQLKLVIAIRTEAIRSFIILGLSKVQPTFHINQLKMAWIQLALDTHLLNWACINAIYDIDIHTHTHKHTHTHLKRVLNKSHWRSCISSNNNWAFISRMANDLINVWLFNNLIDWIRLKCDDIKSFVNKYEYHITIGTTKMEMEMDQRLSLDKVSLSLCPPPSLSSSLIDYSSKSRQHHLTRCHIQIRLN